jgi:hypothetical protein
MPRQTWPRLTLLVNSEMRGKAVSEATFGGQIDQVHTSGETHSYGVEIDRRDLPNRVTTSFTLVGSELDLARDMSA